MSALTRAAMVPPRRRWRAGAVVASLCLAGSAAQGAAGEKCVDQDERWAAHGSNCRKMKRLCEDKGYGALVRTWCPKSCGLCGQEDNTAPALASAVQGAEEAEPRAKSMPGQEAGASRERASEAGTDQGTATEANATEVNSTPAAAENVSWEWTGQGNLSVAAPETTTTTASAQLSTTTTAAEAAQPLEPNWTDHNGSCTAEAAAADEDQAEAPLLYSYTAGPEALAPAGSLLEIEGPEVVELSARGAETSSIELAEGNASTEAGHNVTTTSTPWELLAPWAEPVTVQSLEADGNASAESWLMLRAKAEGAEAAEEVWEARLGSNTTEGEENSTQEAVWQLDATLRGKRARHQGRDRQRAARGKHDADAQVLKAHADKPVLWIGDPDALPGFNVSDAEAMALPGEGSEVELEEEKGLCPEGYERVIGDVYGGDQFSGSRNFYAESMEDCGRRCTRTPGCGSFEYSPTRKQCFRNSQTRPTHNEDRLDFLFCRRAPCPGFTTEQACIGPSVDPDAYSADLSLRPGSYCIWSGGACQAPMACTDKDCFLPDGGLPGMQLPSWQTLWISRSGLEATMRPIKLAR